jgi:alkanesulfonate monooxygenase SsuD/methylene tetrahydromethanopterin reductase-like flavin-dependent oxidoreductase (luciferase family)
MTECFVSLAAWAEITHSIGLGTLVVNATNRTAGLLAVCVASINQVSGGRYTLGIGAGASPGSKWAAEQRALGIVPRATMGERHRHLAETVSEVRRILSTGRDGSLDGFPSVAGRLPVVVGANSTKLATYAGEHCDGVNVGHWNPRLADIVRAATTAAADRQFDVSVWDTFAPELCDQGHPTSAAHRAVGAGRLILTVAGAPDPAAVAACARYLR